jgi:hypothetical protein
MGFGDPLMRRLYFSAPANGSELVKSPSPQGPGPQPAFTFGSPSSFELRRLPSDGRFIFLANTSDQPAQSFANPPIQVVLNWFEELKQRMPSSG